MLGSAASIPAFSAVHDFGRTVAARIEDSFHCDFYGQASAKVGRGLEHDLGDVQLMVRHGLLETGCLVELFSTIESDLIRDPQIDSGGLRKRLPRAVRNLDS